MGKLRHFRAVLWIGFYIVLIDIGISLLFAYPTDPRNVSPSGIQLYFEHGRSVEGKLGRMTRQTDDESAPIVGSGWLENDKDHFLKNLPENREKPVVTIYGMSHANLLAYDMVKCDTRLAFRSVTAPGAGPTWSFSAHTRDKKYHSDVVILGVMTDSVALMSTTSGATMFFDSAYPYTYPRYSINDGELKESVPPFLSVAGYRDYFYSPVKWKEYRTWLSQNDKFYDPLLFRQTILDKSSLFRALRRSYANITRRSKHADVYDSGKGFNMGSEEVRVLQSIVVKFAESARSENSIPVIYLVNNLNTSDHLYKALEGVLEGHEIPYLSSHTIIPSDNPRFYLPDSHFVPDKNLEIAKAMLQKIHGLMVSKATGSEVGPEAMSCSSE